MRSLPNANSEVSSWRAVGIALALLIPISVILPRTYTLPWSSLRELPATPHLLQDVGLVASGFRRAAADLAWVQMLQYVGSDDLFDDTHLIVKGAHSHHGHSHGPADAEPCDEPSAKMDLHQHALRIVRLDPFFGEAYLFAAGILAWSPSLDRPDEAMELLREGARAMPDYWPIQSYIAAILYKKDARPDEMTAILERAILHPQCPITVKTILANYYKSQRRHADAIRVWGVILNNPKDAWYHDHAARQMEHLLQMPRSATP